MSTLPSPFGNIRCIVSDHCPKDRIGFITENQLKEIFKQLEFSTLNRVQNEYLQPPAPRGGLNKWLSSETFTSSLKPSSISSESILQKLQEYSPSKLLYGIACSHYAFKRLGSIQKPTAASFGSIRVIIDIRMDGEHYELYWDRDSFNARLEEQNEFDVTTFTKNPQPSGEA
jgi:hypothetical protein